MTSLTPAVVWPAEAPGANENDALWGLVKEYLPEDLPVGWSRRTIKTGAFLVLDFNGSFSSFPYFFAIKF